MAEPDTSGCNAPLRAGPSGRARAAAVAALVLSADPVASSTAAAPDPLPDTAFPAADAPSEAGDRPQPTIVVTGRPLDQARGIAASATETIGRDRLLGVASGRLEDALRDVAGFQQFRRLDSRTANPSTQGGTLRGLGGNATTRSLVLLDGVPQGDPFAGWIAWSALGPERLSEVRVQRGGGSSAFGSGAVAGVVALESAGPRDRGTLIARGLGGSRDSLEAFAGTAVQLGAGFVTLDARLDRGAGFIIIPASQRGPIDIPARYEVWSVAGRALVPVAPTAEVQVRLAAFRDTRTRGLPEADNLAEGQDASVRLVVRGDWGLEALGYVQLRNLATRARSANAARTQASTTLDQFRTPATGVGGRVELRPPPQGPVELRFGGDFRLMGGETNERFGFTGGVASGLREAGGRSETGGVFVEADAGKGSLLVTSGVRVDWWRFSDGRLLERSLATGAVTRSIGYPDRSGTEVTGRAGVRYALGERLAIRAAAYSGIRLPTLNELYRPFRVAADATASNPDLIPERLRGFEGGIDWQPAQALRMSATGFANRLEDAVANVTVARGPGTFPQVGFVSAAGSFRQRQNLAAIRARGLEVSGAATLGPLSLAASWAHVDSRVDAEGAAAPLAGKRPAQVPRDQLSATAALSSGRGELALTVRHVAAQFEDDLNQRRLPAATTLDAVVSVPLSRHLSFLLRAENMFDTEVVAGVSAQGIRDLGQPRTLWTGLDLRW